MDGAGRPDGDDSGDHPPMGDDAARGEIVREGRRRAAIWGVLTGLVMTVIALGCILLLYLAVGR